jgi:hypothetical protein
MTRLLLIAAIVALAGSAAQAQTIDPKDLYADPEVSAAASPSEVQLGARVVLVVTAAYDDGVTVNLTQPLDLGPAFEERRRTSTDSTRTDGKKVREWQIEVFAWDLGEIQVPPVQVTFIRGGSAGAVMTNPVPIRVIGSLGDMVDTTQPRDDAPPLPLWRRTWLWVAIGGGVLLVLLVAIGTYLASRRSRARIRYVIPVPVRVSGLFRRPRLGGTAEEALARLEAIDTSGMLERDRKAAYVEMIDVMQIFLGRQLGADLADKTTGELREWVREAPIADGTRAELASWLRECELVKFGGLVPPVDDGRAQLAVAREVVISIAMPTAELAPPPAAPEEAARA